MCRALRKFAGPGPEQTEAEKKAEVGRKKRERRLESALLAALLWLRPQASLLLIFPLPELQEQIADALGPALDIHDLGARFLADEKDWSFDPLDAATIQRQSDYRAAFARQFAQTTQAGVDAVRLRLGRTELHQAEIEALIRAAAGLTQMQANALTTMFLDARNRGQAPKQLAALLDAASKRYLRARAKTAAGTEAWRAWQLGMFSAAAQKQRVANAQVVRTWITARDERVCPRCGSLDGMTQPMGQAFPDGEPPIHPSCRCDLEYEVVYPQ